MKFAKVSLTLGNLVKAEEKQHTHQRCSTGVLSKGERECYTRDEQQHKVLGHSLRKQQEFQMLFVRVHRLETTQKGKNWVCNQSITLMAEIHQADSVEQANAVLGCIDSGI